MSRDWTTRGPAQRIKRPSLGKGHPEADIQRAIVAALRVALPASAVVHHSANEVRRGGQQARRDQGLALGMGVYPGFPDLLVISEGRVLFLEVKSATGSLSAPQRAFRDRICAQGFAWALVRSVDDALGALADHGFASRARRAE